jgi:uncharacterized damage-inducible protein DinB
MAGVLEDHFRMFALYNRWANAQLYAAAAKLPEAELAAPRGAFFGSVLGVFNHLLVADRVWLGRLTGNSPVGQRLDEVLFTSLAPLAAARTAEDARLIDHVFTLTDEKIASTLPFLALSGAPMEQKLSHLLAHIFNHQTHHRGQAHDLMCQIGGRDAVPVLDLVHYQRNILPGDTGRP